MFEERKKKEAISANFHLFIVLGGVVRMRMKTLEEDQKDAKDVARWIDYNYRCGFNQ